MTITHVDEDFIETSHTGVGRRKCVQLILQLRASYGQKRGADLIEDVLDLVQESMIDDK